MTTVVELEKFGRKLRASYTDIANVSRATPPEPLSRLLDRLEADEPREDAFARLMRSASADRPTQPQRPTPSRETPQSQPRPPQADPRRVDRPAQPRPGEQARPTPNRQVRPK